MTRRSCSRRRLQSSADRGPQDYRRPGARTGPCSAARRSRERLRRILSTQLRIGRRRGALRADDAPRARLQHHERAAWRQVVRRRRCWSRTSCSCRSRAKAGCRFATSSSATASRCAIGEERLATLFLKGSSRSTFDQARAIMDEGARYNIGNVSRNINVPTLPLPFLTAPHRHRFSFKAGEAR